MMLFDILFHIIFNFLWFFWKGKFELLYILQTVVGARVGGEWRQICEATLWLIKNEWLM